MLVMTNMRRLPRLRHCSWSVDMPLPSSFVNTCITTSLWSAVGLPLTLLVLLLAFLQVNKQTSELVFDHLHATAFQHSPLGRTILGPEENIRSISRQDLVDYMSAHYRCGTSVSYFEQGLGLGLQQEQEQTAAAASRAAGRTWWTTCSTLHVGGM
jgi:hypothetical protein